KHGSQVWLINTGWTGGAPGVGSRIKLAYTRAMLRAALNGELVGVPLKEDPIFGMAVPATCPGVPADLLQPRKTWRNPAEYDQSARHLAALFQANFKKFAGNVTSEVKKAGPVV